MVKWLPDSTFKQVFYQYESFLMHRYGTCIVVFDGYVCGPTTKDHKHMVRTTKRSLNYHGKC